MSISNVATQDKKEEQTKTNADGGFEIEVEKGWFKEGVDYEI